MKPVKHKPNVNRSITLLLFFVLGVMIASETKASKPFSILQVYTMLFQEKMVYFRNLRNPVFHISSFT